MGQGNAHDPANRARSLASGGSAADATPALLHRVASNDAAVGTSALQQCAAMVFRLARALGLRHEEAVEPTIECCVRACEPSEPTACAHDGLLHGVPIERVIDPLLPAAYRVARTLFEPRNTPATADPAASTVRSHIELLLLDLLGVLDEPKRTRLWLADVEGYSSIEIAAITDTRLDVVYDELHKARRAFVRALARHERGAASSDPEARARELLDIARARFSAPPQTLATICEATQRRLSNATRRNTP